MCCQTHHARDLLDADHGIDVKALLASDEQFRCRCPFGNPCQRAMTAEDLRCNWCRGTNHQRACQDLGNDVMWGGSGNFSILRVELAGPADEPFRRLRLG